jgi:hypothetical protein
LGLRCPSEATYSLFLALVVVTSDKFDRSDIPDPAELFIMFEGTKCIVKSVCDLCTDPVCVQFIPSLPLVARLFKDSERYGLAFKDVLQPVQALPFEMSDLMIAHRAIPLRHSNRQAAGSSAVVPLCRNAGRNQFNLYQIKYQMGIVSSNCLNGNDINLQLLPPLANYRADPPSTPAALALQDIQPIATSIIQSGNEQSNNVEQNK